MLRLSIKPEKVYAPVDYLLPENYNLIRDFKRQDSITKLAPI